MQQNRNEHCGMLIPYVAGECTLEERRLYEAHLHSCPDCREELVEMKQVWDLLSTNVEEAEVPRDLKAQVMGAIFAEQSAEGLKETEPAQTQQTPQTPQSSHTRQIRQAGQATTPHAAKEGVVRLQERRRRGRGVLPFVWSAAALIVIVSASLWNYSLYQERVKLADAPLDQPAQVLSVYTLSSTEPAAAETNGKACIMKQGDRYKLVVYLYGLPETKEQEAYQVWLIRDGQRANAGTFQVDASGLGVLTYELPDINRGFDAIGVTLEPDSKGNQPRGKKVLGTST